MRYLTFSKRLLPVDQFSLRSEGRSFYNIVSRASDRLNNRFQGHDGRIVIDDRLGSHGVDALIDHTRDVLKSVFDGGNASNTDNARDFKPHSFNVDVIPHIPYRLHELFRGYPLRIIRHRCVSQSKVDVRTRDALLV